MCDYVGGGGGGGGGGGAPVMLTNLLDMYGLMLVWRAANEALCVV